MGYNVQAAVDTKHHLVVAHEVTNNGSDRGQLCEHGAAGPRGDGRETKLQAIADRGYFSGPQIKACEEAGITAYVPKPITSNSKAEGRFSKSDFIYIHKDEEYQCPAGERAAVPAHRTRRKGIRTSGCTGADGCGSCTMKAEECTSGQRTTGAPLGARRDSRAATCQAGATIQSRKMKVRRRTVEHVFGTLKHWMGSTHFLTRRLANVSTEMSLQVLAYNLKRVIKLLGMARTMKAMRLAGT